MESEYKGFIIKYNRNDMLHSFMVDSISGKYNTLENAEAAIDRHLKANRKIERLPVFISEQKYRGGAYKEAEITSITESGDIWTVDKKGNRSKISADYNFCCEITDGNKAIINDVLSLGEKAKSITAEAAELIKTVDSASVHALVNKLKK